MNKALDYSVLPNLPVADAVEFRHIPGFFGYCVGSDGSLWTAVLPNKQSRKFSLNWRLKSKWKTRDGYYMVSLWTEDRKERKIFIHSAVLLAFSGPRPTGYDSLHGNGDPSDNRIDNLRWGTRKENLADAKRHGRLLTRERNKMAKMSELRVVAVKALRDYGWTQRDIATVLGVSQPTIHAIVTGKRWGVPA